MHVTFDIPLIKTYFQFKNGYLLHYLFEKTVKFSLFFMLIEKNAKNWKNLFTIENLLFRINLNEQKMNFTVIYEAVW